jgi:hypothetical protein
MHNASSVPRLELVTKANCHLCAEARAAVARVADGLGLSWSELSMDLDESLARRFAEEVPVVLVDGVQRDFWTVDEERLARLLRSRMDGRD